MSEDLIKAHMNLYAVLQNLEELVRLDREMAELIRTWDVVIQFSVRRGPAAHLEFKNGTCRHGRGLHPSPHIKLYFLSAGHLNRMFEGKTMPIPLRGFGRLGFLKRDFGRLTERLEQYLRAKGPVTSQNGFEAINTSLTMSTAVHAVRELALVEPVSQRIAASMPSGAVQIEVLPNGPQMSLVFGAGDIAVQKTGVQNPMAKMTFKNMGVANDLLTGKSDAFLAIADGDIVLRGVLPMIDNLNLMMDRATQYLR